ncbi:MAG: glycosyltransferase [Eubacteriales bacterium]|nr:glycosyltransferase [Eubacteriales bacterium]
MEQKKPLVSISCITYNHGPYIRQALEGFLSQRTDFPYEILIHDDASTDNTQEIIREYEAKYPDIIKPIYRTENQYSKGICNVSGAFNFPRARGKYIAMCEGDDYWCDPDKLKLQADYMEAHPECSMCFHAARIITESKAFVRKEIRPYRESRTVPAAEVIDKPFNYPTASLFFKTELGQALPAWYHDCPIGDIPIHIFMASRGSVYYFDRFMSVYRLGVATSWTTQMQAGDAAAVREKHRQHLEDLRRMYTAFDTETGGKFHAAVEAALLREDFLTELNVGNFSVVTEKDNRKYINELPQPQKTLLMLQAEHPGLYGFLRSCYYRLKGSNG